MAAIVGTSTGYVGTSPAPSIGSDKWAKLQAMFGTEYFVASSTAARVTVVSGLTVRIAAGASAGSPQYIGGGGVVDALTGSTDLPLPTPGSDGTTYRPVYARRTWGATNATTFEYGAAITTQTMPTRTNDPGISTDEQPLALVRIVKSGSTLTATVVDDLRPVGYGKGFYEASSELVLSYMNKPGYRVRIGGTEWLRTMAGTWEKVVTPVEVITTPSVILTSEPDSSFAVGSLSCSLVRDGRWRSLTVEQYAADALTITSGSTGNIADTVTFRLNNPRDYPAQTEETGNVRYRYAEGGGSTFGAGRLLTSGAFVIANLMPGLNLVGTGASGTYDLRVTISYYAGQP